MLSLKIGHFNPVYYRPFLFLMSIYCTYIFVSPIHGRVRFHPTNMLGTCHPPFHNTNRAHFGLILWSFCAKSSFNFYYFGTTSVKPRYIAMVTRRVVGYNALQCNLTTGGHTGRETVLNENG